MLFNTWVIGIVCAIAIAALGCNLDGIDDNSAEWDRAVDLQDAINAAIHQRKFEQSAQALCGPQSPWVQQPDGSVQCATKHGKPTILVRVSP